MAEDQVKHEYKLIYFPSRGAAELSRLVFKVAGVEFTDERIPREEWLNKKPDQPLKALPVLEIDGKKYCQSAAISRYLAREFDLMGSTNEEALRIDELQEAMTELFREFMKVFFEKDEVKKEEFMNVFKEQTVFRMLDFFTMRLQENNDGVGFFIGESISLADLLAYNGLQAITDFLAKIDFDLMKSYPLLHDHYIRMGAHPRITEWIKSRPQTEY